VLYVGSLRSGRKNEPPTHGLGSCARGPEEASRSPRAISAWQSLAKRVLAGPRRSSPRSSSLGSYRAGHFVPRPLAAPTFPASFAPSPVPALDRLAEYGRHEPEKTLLHEVVREHLESFLANSSCREQPTPRFIEQELRAFLRCGVLAHGFLRLHCDECPLDVPQMNRRILERRKMLPARRDGAVWRVESWSVRGRHEV
jgi:hypothetical protein